MGKIANNAFVNNLLSLTDNRKLTPDNLCPTKSEIVGVGGVVSGAYSANQLVELDYISFPEGDQNFQMRNLREVYPEPFSRVLFFDEALDNDTQFIGDYTETKTFYNRMVSETDTLPYTSEQNFYYFSGTIIVASKSALIDGKEDIAVNKYFSSDESENIYPYYLVLVDGEYRWVCAWESESSDYYTGLYNPYEDVGWGWDKEYSFVQGWTFLPAQTITDDV